MYKGQRTIKLNEVERQTLEQMRAHHAKPYMREKAAALLRIADGQSAHEVAINGILKPREPDTIYRWLNSYERNGIAGLFQPVRRRRAFSPSGA